MPKRIQRQRTRGWRIPPNCVCVTRPGRFGNPYDVRKYGLDLSLRLFAQTARGCWNPTLVAAESDERVNEIYELHCAWLKRLGHRPIEAIHCELRGKDLACWCPVTSACHADVLLEIANA